MCKLGEIGVNMKREGSIPNVLTRVALAVRAQNLLPKSTWYFMSTASLRSYVRDSLSLRKGA